MTETHDPWREPLKEDCRKFRFDRPCAPHKTAGKTCPSCDEYDPVTQRVLVVKLAAVGDVLRTTALLPAIHREFPRAWLTWLTRPAAAPLLAGNPLIDEVSVSDHGELPAALRLTSYDHVLCPDADPEAAALASAATARSRRGFALTTRGTVQALGRGAEVWYRMGLRDELKRRNSRTYQDLIADVLELNTRVVERPMLPLHAAEREAAAAFLRGLPWPQGTPVVGINTGAGGRWEYKRWTLPHQQGFIQRMHQRGRAVLLLGGPEEEERNRALLDACRGLRVADAGTRNTLRAFAAKVGVCAAVVTGDTMALHMAVALGRPVVALFGPTSAAEIHLYGQGEKLQPPGLDCLVCYLSRCDKTPYCQELIDPERVAAAVDRLLPT